jgi:hypothetical protein
MRPGSEGTSPGPEGDGASQQLGDPWATSLNMWSAWATTWEAVLQQRGAPVADKAMQKLFDPAAWPAGFMDEIKEFLALPTLADMPSLDASSLPSIQPTFELMSVAQQYLQASIPVWMKACQRFQAEVAEREQRFENSGDALDLWNSVLDQTLMEFNRSAEYAEAQQRFLRATMRQRIEVRNLFERSAKAVDLPTRTELDDVYRRLHDLLREVHDLRREVRSLKRARAAAPQAEKAEARKGVT